MTSPHDTPLGETMHQPPYPPAPRQLRWGRFLAWTIGAAVAACLIGGGIARVAHRDDGGGPLANRAMCKAALSDRYRKVMANGGKRPKASSPPACVGLDEKTLEQITGEVFSEYLKSDQAKTDVDKALKDGMESALATPSASTSVSPECRAWIVKEIQDSSDSVDGASGLKACGDLSDAELQAAIDQVTKELSASIAPSAG